MSSEVLERRLQSVEQALTATWRVHNNTQMKHQQLIARQMRANKQKLRELESEKVLLRDHLREIEESTPHLTALMEEEQQRVKSLWDEITHVGQPAYERENQRITDEMTTTLLHIEELKKQLQLQATYKFEIEGRMLTLPVEEEFTTRGIAILDSRHEVLLHEIFALEREMSELKRRRDGYIAELANRGGGGPSSILEMSGAGGHG